MYFKNYILIAILCPLMFLASCEKNADDGTAPTRWGKENYYEKFLWKKHLPDTLYRTIDFDFNQDAQNYMEKPLRLGLYKKADNGKMLPVTENEMEVFVDGKKSQDNIIEVPSGTDLLKVGIVFNPEAENKVHHWFFKPVDDGGLDRINDMDSDAFSADSSSLMEIEVEKNKVMNPLAEGLMLTGIVLAIVLLVWMFVLKPIIYPTFHVGRIQLTDPVPYNSLKKLKRYRKMVLTNKSTKQKALNRFLTGKIQYEVNQLWTSDVTVEPRNRNSVRLRYPNEYLADARILEKHREYILQNMTTGTKTKIKIS